MGRRSSEQKAKEDHSYGCTDSRKSHPGQATSVGPLVWRIENLVKVDFS